TGQPLRLLVGLVDPALQQQQLDQPAVRLELIHQRANRPEPRARVGEETAAEVEIARASGHPTEVRGRERDSDLVSSRDPHLACGNEQLACPGQVTLVAHYLCDFVLLGSRTRDVAGLIANLRAAFVEVERLRPA